jgi:hypothetical protein
VLMAKAKKAEARPRPRPGSITIELTPVQRAKLERLRDERTRKTGVAETLAGTIRRLIMEGK